MTRERVVKLTVLTACIFAFSIYWQKGTWIFPFPLYELAMLAAVIALLIAEGKRPAPAGILAVVWALLQVGTSTFAQEIFVSEENAASFFGKGIPEYFLLGFVIVFFAWGVLASLKLPSPFWRIAALHCEAGFMVLFLLSEDLWAIAPLAGWLACFVIAGKEAGIHRDILFLFTFFFLSKNLTLALLT